MYVSQDFGHLSKLLVPESGNIKIKDGFMNGQDRFGHDMWLIFAMQSSKRKRISLGNVLEASSIRFDSSIFAFYKDGVGKSFIFWKL